MRDARVIPYALGTVRRNPPQFAGGALRDRSPRRPAAPKVDVVTAPDTLRRTRTGLWTAALESVAAPKAQALAVELDDLGYGSLWLPEAVGREAFTGAQAILAATRRIVVGTGIATIYGRGAMATNGAARLLEALTPERFILGLGVSHRPAVEGARKVPYLPPLEAMADFLDDLGSALYFGSDPVLPPVVLAALGPKMLGLARDRTAGAHSYLVTPAHTAAARETLGTGPLLVVEQAVVLDQERAEGLRRAHGHLTIYTGLPNYRNSWRRQGLGEEDFVKGGSERLVDAMVVLGDEAKVRQRVQEHLDAGADHVVLQVLGAHLGEVPMAEWRILASAVADL
jgi:probable F420-dependent oxidoreductase